MAKVGAKPFYESPEQMQEVIDAYFEKCDGELLLDDEGMPVLDKLGHPIYKAPRPYTVTGLAYALGFTSRQALLNYQGKAAFVDTIRRAKLRCENYSEERLYDRDGQRGSEFSLKVNFKWAVPKEDEGEKGAEGGIIYLPEVGK